MRKRLYEILGEGDSCLLIHADLEEPISFHLTEESQAQPYIADWGDRLVPYEMSLVLTAQAVTAGNRTHP